MKMNSSVADVPISEFHSPMSVMYMMSIKRENDTP